jgi:hypothetical protein
MAFRSTLCSPAPAVLKIFPSHFGAAALAADGSLLKFKS